MVYKTVKAIFGEFQHASLVADIDKKKIRNVVEKDMYREKKDKLAERCKD